MSRTRPKIIVTGANGQLGTSLQQLAYSFPDFEMFFLTHNDLAIDDEQAVGSVLQTIKPDYLVNAAAYTAVDLAESERENAFAINARAVAILGAACRKLQVSMLHISTDYVFDGRANTPYHEDAGTNPQTVYGASKLAGEQELLAVCPDAIIIRTSWVYSLIGKNFLNTMLRLMKEKESLNVVDDQLGSPTYASDLASAIYSIIQSGEWHPGVYHYSNGGIISWYQFAKAIGEMINSSCRVLPIPSSSYPTKAARPFYSALDTSKIQDTYRIAIKDWRVSLEECLSSISLL